MPRTLESQDHTGKDPQLFCHSRGPRRIFNMSRDTKLIVVVRNPVTRAIRIIPRRSPRSRTSLRSRASRSATARWAWWTCPERHPRSACMRCTWRVGWQAFPLAQIHFVSGERLITDPAARMGRGPRTSWALRGSSRTSTSTSTRPKDSLLEKNRIEPLPSMPGQIKRQNSADRP